jgi:hypothetical protein
MGARFGAELDLPGAPAEVLGAVDERSVTAIEQTLFKKNLRNPENTSVASFSNLSQCLVLG